MSASIRNIALRDFRKFLRAFGCELSHSKGGHEIWVKEGLRRPIVLQTHIDPVPLPIVLKNLKTIGISKEAFLAFLEGKDIGGQVEEPEIAYVGERVIE